MKKYFVFSLIFILILTGCGTGTSKNNINDVLAAAKNKTFANISTGSSDIFDKDFPLKEVDIVDILAFDDELKLSFINWVGIYNENDGFVTTDSLLDNIYKGYNQALEQKFSIVEGTDFFITSTDASTKSSIFTIFRLEEINGKVEIKEYVLGQLIGKNDYKHNINIENIKEHVNTLNSIEIGAKSLNTFVEMGSFSEFNAYKAMFVDNPKIKDMRVGLNIPFTFRDMEYTIGEVNGWTKIDNRFSDLNGRDIFKVPVDFKNLSDKPNSLNLFSYTLYGPKGTKLSSISAYVDGDIDLFGDILPGTSTSSFFAILYDGDGEYQIHFDDYKDGIQIKFNVTK